MNKLLAIPLAFIVFLAFVGLVQDSDYAFSGATQYEERTIFNSTSGQWEDVQVPIEDSTINLSGFDGALLLLIAAVAIATVAGISILGSGLSELSQELVLKMAVYGGLWGIFSVMSYQIIGSLALYGPLLWMGLTIMYVIGFTQTVGSTE